jgi:arylsulfatase A-like enzyme/Tfp pilus assembly protein PilF
VVLLALSALLSAGCEGTGAPAPPPARHILLVSIDTLRADALGCYGSARARTDTLDRLASEGVLFRAAISPSPVTLPSHAAMLTGLDPWRLGILHNGIYRLAPRFDSIAEILADEGFETAAVIGGYPLTADSGLDQGFALYDDAIPLGADPGYAHPERRAEEVTDAAASWLRGRIDPARRFFLFVHYYDVHAPYRPPEAYVGAGAAETYPGYRGEVAYVDDQIGRLLDALRTGGLLDETLVVVTSDHGEGLMDHGEPTHSIFLYDEIVRVPLILRFPAAIPGGRIVEEVVGLVDLAPTLLDAVGLAERGRRIDGRSLWPLATREADAHGGAVFSESQVGRLDYGWSPLRSVRTGEWKYVHAPEPELYAIREDPEESSNVISDHREVADRLRERIVEAFRTDVPEARREIDEEELRRLQSLGYLQDLDASGSAEDDAAPAGPDPKTMTATYLQLQLATGEMAAGRHLEAERRLSKLAAEDPGNVTARCRLADARVAQQDYAGARQALREALAVARGIGRAPVIWRMAELERGQRNFDRALAYYREHAEMTSLTGRTVAQISETLEEAGRLSEAEGAVRDWLEGHPSSLVGLRTLARLLDKTGGRDEARETWRAILELRPGDSEAAAALNEPG